MTHPQTARQTIVQQAAYRRLAITILRLDVPSLTAELTTRHQPPARLPLALREPARRAA